MMKMYKQKRETISNNHLQFYINELWHSPFQMKNNIFFATYVTLLMETTCT